jgi:hypothetical protein
MYMLDFVYNTIGPTPPEKTRAWIEELESLDQSSPQIQRALAKARSELERSERQCRTSESLGHTVGHKGGGAGS